MHGLFSLNILRLLFVSQAAEKAADLKPNEFTYWNTLGVIAASEGMYVTWFIITSGIVVVVVVVVCCCLLFYRGVCRNRFPRIGSA